MKRLIISTAMTASLCLTIEAHAYTLFGFGTQSCGKVVQSLDLEGQSNQGSAHLDYANWLTGYLSGANAWAKTGMLEEDQTLLRGSFGLEIIA